MVSKKHRWRLRNDTFWNIHFISNSKRLGKFLGANQIPALCLDQILLSPHSHVNNQIGRGLKYPFPFIDVFIITLLTGVSRIPKESPISR
jgi:hypothetical protein